MNRAGSKNWRPPEDDYLQENWGKYSIPTIAKHLNRSVNAVKCRAQRLGLGPVLMGGDYITLNKLVIAVKGTNAGGGYVMKSWVENRGLPVHTRKVGSNSFRVVYLDEFWEWAERNRSFIDFNKMEPLALGEEPAWVSEQRKRDFQGYAVQRKDPWTSEEDSRLKMLLKMHKYGYAELSAMLHRSAGAIQRRCTDLDLKERPVKADNHSADSKWTQADYNRLAEGIRTGESYTLIGNAIGKSEKAIRGKVYFVYLTENADKVRAMLGNGMWGEGDPVPTVRQAVHLSRTRTAVNKDLVSLVTVLKIRRNQLGYDPYFQRLVCMNWDDIGGCSAGCTDCDSCTEFQRIKQQYCARCGATFLELKPNRFCSPCREARKKQHQRKWHHLHGKDKPE